MRYYLSLINLARLTFGQVESVLSQTHSERGKIVTRQDRTHANRSPIKHKTTHQFMKQKNIILREYIYDRLTR